MHKEVLKLEAANLWEEIKNFDDISDFYLAGGTGLALQIGHRISVDFDFFSENQIKKNLLDNLEKFFGKQLQVLVKSKDELTVIINGVKTSFIYYPFKNIFQFENISVIKFASIKEISLMKAYALGRRQSIKDYIDIYQIVSSGLFSLSSIIKYSQEKYGELFNDRLFLEQLVYLDDFTDEPIIWLADSVSKEEILNFFEKEVNNYLKTELN